jgi:hypothetical protein
MKHLRRHAPLLFLFVSTAAAQEPAPLRPPATPLIAHDPYFSVWSNADRLNDKATVHWTGTEQAITGLVRIDGVVYRFMGAQPRAAAPIPPMKQVSFRLTPTRTIYAFEGGGIRMDLTFMTPALPADLDILSRPVTYLSWQVRSADGRPRKVKIYVDCTSQLAVNRPEQQAMWSRTRVGDLEVARLGSTAQEVLSRSGDDLRIDWGYLYMAALPGPYRVETLGSTTRDRASYANNLELPEPDDTREPPAAPRFLPLIGVALDLGEVGSAEISPALMVAYDDLYSIEHFQRRLRPYWRKDRMGAAALLKAAAGDFPRLKERCTAFDEEITRDLVRAGGPRYAALAILAYRQTLAAHKLVADFDGRPMYFSKENFSNGCIATVDVTYPSSPFFLLFNPGLLEAQLRPVLDYARSPRWRWPFAPHDLGTYPLANGQVYGGGEETEDRQMPVEESGNMLIMLAALAHAQGNAEFSRDYWPTLSRWAAYLRDKGLDPENQLCTDDFAGHLAHNTNLSIKAILGLASYAALARRLGHGEEAAAYGKLAREMAAKWPAMADDGDHHRLAFDRPDTWSQKYNLVWDRILGFGLFPESIARTEIAYYLTRQNAYGLPLDSRETYTKIDWVLWTATLAEDRNSFEALADPAYRFANETPDRVPLTDWYWTLDARRRGFQARSVVGGIFIKMLAEPGLWRKWSGPSASTPARDRLEPRAAP